MQLFITGKLLSHAEHLDTKLHYRKPRRWETADRKNDEFAPRVSARQRLGIILLEELIEDKLNWIIRILAHFILTFVKCNNASPASTSWIGQHVKFGPNVPVGRGKGIGDIDLKIAAG